MLRWLRQLVDRAPAITDDPQLPVVLHVEDNLAESKLLEEAMASHGWPVRCHRVASHAEAAMFLNQIGAYRSAPIPALIVVDLHLASSDGRGLIGMLAKHAWHRDLRVVVLSGSITRGDRAYCRSLGVPCFEKPMTLDGFASVIASMRRVAA